MKSSWPRWRSTSCAMLPLLFAFAIPRPAVAQQAPNVCGTVEERAAAGNWFRQINQAWERLDPVGATGLFADNAQYQDYPFDAPLRGGRAIRAYWNEVARAQRDVHTSFAVLSACGHTSIVHWTASFVRVPSGQKVRLDGIAEVTLDKHGKCVLFREWWDREQE